MDFLDPDFSELSSHDLDLIDRLCGDYERRRRSGEQLDPRSFSDGKSEPLRTAIEREIVGIELEILDGWDDANSIEPLIERWPQLEAVIRAVWMRTRMLGKILPPVPLSHSDSGQHEFDHAENGEVIKDGFGSISSVKQSERVRRAGVGAGCRFEIVRHLAQGGIGNVFVAYDHDLHREVAFKELKLKFLDNPMVLARFQNEATITGLLEHPNIVPVYATGIRRDGRPFYAMRLIRGRSLHDAAVEVHSSPQLAGKCINFRREPAARDLLLRFIAVCKAMSFAHSRGVIHRDIKPGNIMVGDFGETLVVDWGLAKQEGKTDVSAAIPKLNEVPNLNELTAWDNPATLHESGDSTQVWKLDVSAQCADTPRYSGNLPTVPGSVVGTPGFMSPEQAAGISDQVTRASDIYSLGATLEFLLTGKLSPDARAHLITGQPAVHSAVVVPQHPTSDTNAGRAPSRNAIPASLAAICRQAQHRDPLLRYPSADRLAEDLESWLADEPLSVIQDPPRVRLRRWARNHPALTGSVLSGVAILLAAMAVGLSVLSSKNESLRLANEREQQASQQARANAKVAEEHSAEAVKQRQRVLAILNSFLIDVERGLEGVPGGAAVQRNVLTRVLNQLGTVSREFTGDKQVDTSNAMALIDMADLFVRCGKQDIDIDFLGDDQKTTPLKAAELMYNEALRIVRSLDGGEPSSDGQAAELKSLESSILVKLAGVHLQLADTAQARHDLEKALSLSRELVAADADPEDWNALVTVLDMIGQIQLQDSDFKQAQVTFAEIRAVLQPIANDAEAPIKIKRQWGIVHSRLADIAFQNNELEQAAELYAVDLKISQDLFQSDPENATFERDLCVSLDRLGNINTKRGKIPEALVVYVESLGHRQKLSSAEPSDMRAMRELLVSNIKCGDTRMLLNDIDGADKDYRAALQAADNLAAADGDSALARRFQSLSLEVLADLSLSRSNNPAALEFAKRSIEITRQLAMKDPENGQWRRDLMLGHAKVAKVLLAMDERDGSLAELQSALRIAEETWKKNPGSGEAAEDVLFITMRIAKNHLGFDSFQGALQACDSALAILRSLPESQLQDAMLRRRLVNTLTMHAEALVGESRWEDAQKSLSEAKSNAEEMVKLEQRAEQMRLDLKDIANVQSAIDAGRSK
ncbi:MAG: protein kinase [Pirellulales bacterium]